MSRPTRSVISEARAVAWAAGHNTFTVPTPCANGHYAPRYASNGICITCVAEYPSKTPKSERVQRLAGTDTRPVQLYQDAATASLAATSKKRFGELSGRPVSQNLVYRAAMRALTLHLASITTKAEANQLLF
jgi:hypothetical protein